MLVLVRFIRLVIATIRVKLKAQQKQKGPGRNKYQESSTVEMSERNGKMAADLKKLIRGSNNIEPNRVRTIGTGAGSKRPPDYPKERKGLRFFRKNKKPTETEKERSGKRQPKGLSHARQTAHQK